VSATCATITALSVASPVVAVFESIADSVAGSSVALAVGRSVAGSASVGARVGSSVGASVGSSVGAIVASGLAWATTTGDVAVGNAALPKSSAPAVVGEYVRYMPKNVNPATISVNTDHVRTNPRTCR